MTPTTQELIAELERLDPSKVMQPILGRWLGTHRATILAKLRRLERCERVVEAFNQWRLGEARLKDVDDQYDALQEQA
jgi:hypothetical protein